MRWKRAALPVARIAPPPPEPLIVAQGTRLGRWVDKRRCPPAWSDPAGRKPWRDRARPLAERAGLYLRYCIAVSTHRHPRAGVLPRGTKGADDICLKSMQQWLYGLHHMRSEDEYQAVFDLDEGEALPPDVPVVPVYVEYPIRPPGPVVLKRQMPTFSLWAPLKMAVLVDKVAIKNMRTLRVRGHTFVWCRNLSTVLEDARKPEGFVVQHEWQPVDMSKLDGFERSQRLPAVDDLDGFSPQGALLGALAPVVGGLLSSAAAGAAAPDAFLAAGASVPLPPNFNGRHYAV